MLDLGLRSYIFFNLSHAYTGASRTVKPEHAAHLNRSMSHSKTGVRRTLFFKTVTKENTG